MTEDAPDRILSGIDIPKTIAGVLAALSAAVVGSFLGVAGTLIGAAVASVIGSVGTEVYHRSINKGRHKLKGTFTTAPAAVGTPPIAAAPFSPAQDSSAPPRKVRWNRVALLAGALFVLAMGTLTVAELVAGRSVADVTRGDTGDRSTVSSIFGGKSEKSTPKPVPSTSDAPGTDSPTTTPTTAPTEAATPTTEATTAPETDAPTGDPAAPTGGSGIGDSGTGDSGTGDSGTGDSGTGGSSTEGTSTGGTATGNGG